MKDILGIQDSIDELKSSGREYLDLKMDSIKLRLVDNLSVVCSKLLVIFVVILLAVTALIFLASGLNTALGDLWSPMAADLFTAALFIVLAAIVYALRKRLFIDSLVRTFAKVFFESEENVHPTKEGEKP